jgi:hypothetical protein
LGVRFGTALGATRDNRSRARPFIECAELDLKRGGAAGTELLGGNCSVLV